MYVLTCHRHTHVNAGVRGGQRSSGDHPGAEITDGCKLCDVGAGTSHLQEQFVLLGSVRRALTMLSVKNRACEDRSSNPEPVCTTGGHDDSSIIPAHRW